MGRLRPVVAIVLASGIFFAVSAAADDWATCTSMGDNADAVTACTHVIASAKLGPRALALAYNWRAYHFNSRGQYDSAIADYTEVMKLDPVFLLTSGYPIQETVTGHLSFAGMGEHFGVWCSR